MPLRVHSVPVVAGVNVLMDTAAQSYTHTHTHTTRTTANVIHTQTQVQPWTTDNRNPTSHGKAVPMKHNAMIDATDALVGVELL